MQRIVVVAAGGPVYRNLVVAGTDADAERIAEAIRRRVP
jgi:hypothetical protein